MANCLFSPLNWVALAGVSFSGGDWEADLSLANLATTDMLVPARSTSADDADTVFTVDLGAQRLWDTLHLAYANLSPAAEIRVTTDEAYDSGWLPAYPVTHVPVGGYLPFGRPSADGKMPEDERDPRGVCFLLVLDAALTASEITVAIRDEANPAGFLQAAGLWIAKSERPRINLQNGFAITPLEESTVRRSRGGTLLGRRLWQRRRIAGKFQWQHRDVAFGQWLEGQRRVGSTLPVLFSVMTGMGVHQDRTTILGFLDEPTPIEHVRFLYHGWAFAITEA